MSGPLLIVQGSPNWWNSPAIWVTSVSDPSTPELNPIAGQIIPLGPVSNKYCQPVEGGTWCLFVC
jgi:hypothetical protein